MKFEIGKCYKHTSGEEMKIVGEVESTMYGKTLVGETNRSFYFSAISRDEESAVNWIEISEEQWMKNFS